jgi:hypothetical protein
MGAVVTLHTNGGDLAPFHMVFYGWDVFDKLMMIGDESVGGHIVRRALKRRGLNPDDYVSSVFSVSELTVRQDWNTGYRPVRRERSWHTSSGGESASRRSRDSSGSGDHFSFSSRESTRPPSTRPDAAPSVAPSED